MSCLARGALLLSCAALSCSYASDASDAGDRLMARGHAPAHPSLLGAPGAGAASHTGGAGTSSDAGADGGSAQPTPEEPVASCPDSPWVLAPHLRNARDVGGTPLERGGSVACGAVFRGPPLTLTTAGCEQARALGLRTVIDLRVDSERVSRPDATCTGADFLPAPLPIPYGLSASDYLADLHATASIVAVFHAFGDPARYPIYFHCTWGRDRTGVVAAVLLLTLGVSPEDVMAEYLLSQAVVGAYPSALQAVLDEIESLGGPDAFLAGIGISEEEIAVIRSMSVE